MTIHEVKSRHMAMHHESHFFDRNTMLFFHQTMRSFRVKYIGDDRYEIRAPMRDSRGAYMGDTVRIFDYNTGELNAPKEE